MATFVKFTEFNDHEGETWVFWLQLDGNEMNLVALEQIIQDVQGREAEEPYSLDMSIELPEEHVDVLVEHGGSGYMDYHNKVSGVMKDPFYVDLVTDVGYGPELDGLYKGGVNTLFVND